MHLKLLKLSGFKSFVDPTVIPFPSQLVAVVGPNGCGKSNIIDAVRWVMGESSAKNLRGESMTDVIFNGSAQRKAVGQATIELVFDNSLGRLTGQYTSYQEISVKRILTRDGDSAYFLNGSRCRRRDITDIFLGTGAGSRGYSVISQGTISRIIEARPEELRVYLEEAAGISKYKERRRETLSRIDQTRENLLRVADIREELDKQLHRLEHQAKTAARYKTLKSEERLCKLEILALKWQTLTVQQEKKQIQLRRLTLDYEKHQANAAEAFKNSSELREQNHLENELFQEIQKNFYQLATEIARLEEGIKQHQREQQQLIADQHQKQRDWQTISDQVAIEEKTLADSQSRLLELEENLQVALNEFKGKQQSLQKKLAQQASWNSNHQRLQAALNKSLAQVQVEDLRLQHLAERRQQILLRLEKINDESASLAIDDISETLDSQQILLKNLQNQQQIAQEKHHQSLDCLNIARELLANTNQALHQAQDEIHRLRTKQSSLTAAKQVALGYEDTKPATQAWADKPRLVETISVEKDWQLACELVLGESLQAIMLDSLDDLWKEIHHMKASSAIFMSYKSSEKEQNTGPCLADKIQGSKPTWIHRLDKIYTASSLDEALASLATLKPEESIITKEGCWLSKGWVKIAGSSSKEAISLIHIQEELKELHHNLAEAEKNLSFLKIKRDELFNQVSENEAALELEKQALFNSREDLRACETTANQQLSLLEQSERRKNALADEADNLRSSLEEVAVAQEEAFQLAESAKGEAKKFNEELAKLTSEKTIEDLSLEKNRAELEEARATENQIQLQAERERLKIAQIISNLKKERVSLATLQTQLENQASRLLELNSPNFSLQKTLDEKIIQHSELEKELNQCKERLNRKAEQLESWENLVKSEEKFAKNLQEKIQDEKLQEQKLAVQASSLLESFNELDGQLETILAAIPATINQAHREQELAKLSTQITDLGAINLAAIDEYDSEFQRKQHLDNQYQDLTEALSMLEVAIEKMDKETNQRLQNTFNDLNTAFQSLFPRLFGGGRAMLELTCDNLLEAGVLVMAQPPGKRNSTIHLLSGGEKAMTAVALVFAIFQLNPSPFCLLDEVDAPLDDVNVGRFCNLVKEMSKFVQFLFITHNKVTMELADHLIGVTMREPGVSRIVTVAVEEALAMAEA